MEDTSHNVEDINLHVPIDVHHLHSMLNREGGMEGGRGGREGGREGGKEGRRKGR